MIPRATKQTAVHTDLHGGVHSVASPAAIAAFDAAVSAVAGHRPDAAAALDRALAAAPNLVAAHALRGFGAVMLARAELQPVAAGALAAARAALRACDGGTRFERMLIEALACAVRGHLDPAAACLEAGLRREPTCLLPLKLAHALRFMLGDGRGMLAMTTSVLSAWTPAIPGYGFVLGCHAFGLEEGGQLRAAEVMGRRAVAFEPRDAWGLHAVAHVHETEGRADCGSAWLEATRPAWRGCNNFTFHLAWHLALFQLERGRHERVLEIYDTEVRPRPTDDVRDVANAVSLLWRLEQEGVAVGRRWAELAEIAARRRSETTLVFATLHNLLALLAAGDDDAAHAVATALRRRAEGGQGDQAGVAERVGADLAQSLISAHRGGTAALGLARLAERLPALGGSHVQRDLFMRTLAVIAAERGDAAACVRILDQRRRLKRDDRFAFLLRGRLAAAGRRLHHPRAAAGPLLAATP